MLTRLNFYKAQIEEKGASSKERSRGAEKGATNPAKGKGRAADGPFPKPKAPVKGAKIPKAPVR